MISIDIATRDRPCELALLLQSLRTQTHQEFDIFILDDMSGTPLNNYHFLNMIIARMKLEGHKISVERTEYNHGVSKARHVLAEKSMDYEYILRVDDDVILAKDYLERMLKVIKAGYDIASGVTPTMGPQFIRNSKMVEKANEVCFEGDKIVYDGDDCGIEYTDDKIVPADHFRSCALIKREVHKQVKYWPTRLTKHGYREETLFSFNAVMKGFKIGVDLGANAWHLMTPSGGERFAESNQMIQQNQKMLNEFIAENKAELKAKFKGKVSKLKLKKETNLIK